MTLAASVASGLPTVAFQQDADLAFTPGGFKVVYLYTIPGSPKHEGLIKIGDATFHLGEGEHLEDFLEENPEASKAGELPWRYRDDRAQQYVEGLVRQAAQERVKHQTGTAGVAPTILAQELALRPGRPHSGEAAWVAFRDHDVHRLLQRAGVPRVKPDPRGSAREWFRTTLSEALTYLRYVQQDITPTFSSLEAPEKIVLREEQHQAVEFLSKQYARATREEPVSLLLSAIMRFGKTLTTYHYVAQNKEEIKKVLIITHRPVTRDGWFKDFQKTFPEGDYVFSSSCYGLSWEQGSKHERQVHFMSMQDLRGSQVSGESEDEASERAFVKNAEIFATEWDLIVVDEAHEGTRTTLAQEHLEQLSSPRWLQLSGTPMNIMEDFDTQNIYTWDYILERKACEAFAEKHPQDMNPYASLPIIKLFTYDLSKAMARVRNDKDFFNLSELFKVVRNNNGTLTFRYAESIEYLLNLLCQSGKHESLPRHMPFNSAQRRETFAHTFWVVPSVAAAKLLQEMLEEHPYFSHFHVMNVAGAGAENKTMSSDAALQFVQQGIKEHKQTITLSVGRLTTGVTVPEWSAVFLLSGMKSPMTYLQTIFRAKSGGVLPDGSLKQECYVFDFDPDRTLEMVATMSQNRFEQRVAGGENVDSRTVLEETLEFLPIIANRDARFHQVSASKLMQALNRVMIDRAVGSGFDCASLYDQRKLMEIDQEALSYFEKTRAVVGSKQRDTKKAVVVSCSGITKEQQKLLDTPPEQLTAEQKVERAKASEAEKLMQKNLRTIKATLRAISVRVPMLVFALPLEEGVEITVDNFPELVDDASWEEFFPPGFVKEGEEGASWTFVKQFLNPEVFSGACMRVREQVRELSTLPIMERAAHTAQLFATFRNPDKEVVLTPWRVVNLQYGATLGGARWVDDEGRYYCNDGVMRSWEECLDEFQSVQERLEDEEGTPDAAGPAGAGERLLEAETVKLAPQWVAPPEGVRDLWSSSKSTFVDTNSKTALYPLYAAYSLYVAAVERGELEWFSEEELWKRVVEKQVFAYCRVPYSAHMARAVLSLGFDNIKVNAAVVDVAALRQHVKLLDRDILDQDSFWRWLLSPATFESVEQRVEKVMSVQQRSELRELAQRAEDANCVTFDAVVSNPPYQEAHGGNSTSSGAVYHLNAMIAQMIGQYVSMIHPLRWTQGGAGEDLDFFRERELASSHYRVFQAYSQSLFPGINIAGGLNIYLWDRENKTSNLNYSYNGKSDSRKNLAINGVFIAEPSYEELLIKIRPNKTHSSTVGPRDEYSVYLSDPTKKSGKTLSIENARKVLSCANNENGIKVYYVERGVAVRSRNISAEYIDSRAKNLGAWKVFVSRTTSKVKNLTYTHQDRIFIGEPNSACSSTFLSVGCFDTEQEAINCLRYMKTAFASKLCALLTPTQQCTRENYSLIPAVDFATGEILDHPGKFLDFSKPETLDDQLAAIYELTEEEQELLAADIKPWKDRVDINADK